MSRKPNARLANLRAEIQRAVEAHQAAMAQHAEHSEAEMIRRDIERANMERAERLKLPEVKPGGQV